MGVIRDKAKLVYSSGPIGAPAEPDKSDIIALNGVIEDAVTGAGAGLVRATTLAGLTAGTRVGQPGQVTAGAGKGEYLWNGSDWVYAGPYTDAVVLQDNIDSANGWRIFFNTVPLLLDASGVVDGTARVYIPQRKFFSTSDKSIDVYTGTAVGAAFPGYEAITITRFREDSGGNPVFVWYDLDDPTNPIKQSSYNTFPPLDRPERIVMLLTVGSNGFYSSPVRVVEISGLDGGAIFPLDPVVREGNTLLIPSFYQYHWALNAGVVKPATGRFFEYTPTTANVYTYYYDNMTHAAGGSPIKEVVGANQYPRKEGYRLYKIIEKGDRGLPLQGEFSPVSPFRMADQVRNQWPEGKTPDNAARLFTNGVVADSPAELTAAGFARCVQSSDANIYYGGDIGVTGADGTGLRAFGRFYLHSTVDNSWATGSAPYLMHFWDGETFLGNLVLTIEKVVNSKLAIISGSGIVSAKANRFYIGSAGTTVGQHSIGGGQAWFGTAEHPWISRADYPAEISGSNPIVGKELFMVTGRPLSVYPLNLTGGRDDTPIKGGFYSLKGSDNLPYFVEGADQITIDPARCGTTGGIVFRRTGPGGDKEARLSIDVSLKISAAAKTGSPKILAIGDSITNGGMPRAIDRKLQAMGVTATWMGTINTTDTYFSENATDGLPGEGRGGRSFGDHIYKRTVNMVPVTDVPAYLAGDKASKIGKNPFIRPSTGGDASNLIFNGYVFDFAQYRTNYLAGVSPDIVLIGLGTNDRVFQNDANAVADALDGLRVMMTQIRAALPSAKIGWWIPPSPRSHQIEGPTQGAWARQQKIIRHNVAWLLANGDANMHVVPTWAHISPEVGWWQGLATPGASDNVRKSSIFDVIHFGPDPAPLREQCAETLFAFIANVS